MCCSINEKTETQINELNSPETEAHKYNQLIFDKSTKAIQWERVVFSTNGAGTIGYPCKKKRKKSKTLLHTSHKY